MSQFHAPNPYDSEGWRQRCFDVIFGYDTKAGRTFDILLVLAILASVFIVIADSVTVLHARYSQIFGIAEWAFTLLFTIEYLVRLAVIRQPWHYARSFYGVVDLLALMPTYLSLLFPGLHFLAVLRILRILRIFEVLHLGRYTRATSILLDSLLNSWRKIIVFLLAMLTIITIFGALLYIIEGPVHGFTSIPISMYWALVSVSTVGYGDISPATPFGKLAASVLILIGYGIIAVPTGIYTAELATSLRSRNDGRACESCAKADHNSDAIHCRHCGTMLPATKKTN